MFKGKCVVVLGTVTQINIFYEKTKQTCGPDREYLIRQLVDPFTKIESVLVSLDADRGRTGWDNKPDWFLKHEDTFGPVIDYNNWITPVPLEPVRIEDTFILEVCDE